MSEAKDFDNIDFKSLIEPKLLENIECVKSDLLNQNRNFGIILDGVQGMAKTTNGCILARCIQPNFDESKQLGQGIDDFVRAYNYSIDGVKAKYKVVIYDEANDSDRGGSLGRIQRILNQLLMATSRSEKIVIIVILHRFYRLDDKFVENSLVHALLHFHSKSNDKYVKFNAYDIDSMLWMLACIKRNKIIKRPKVYSMSAPNFGGRILAPPEEYMDFIDKVSKKGKDMLRKKNTRDILASQYYTIPVLASMLQVTKQQVSYQIDKLNLRKSHMREKSGKIYYYDKEAFPILKKEFLRIEEERLRRLDNSNK